MFPTIIQYIWSQRHIIIIMMILHRFTIVTQIRRNQKIHLYNIMIVWMFTPGSGRAAWWPGRVWASWGRGGRGWAHTGAWPCSYRWCWTWSPAVRKEILCSTKISTVSRKNISRPVPNSNTWVRTQPKMKAPMTRKNAAKRRRPTDLLLARSGSWTEENGID